MTTGAFNESATGVVTVLNEEEINTAAAHVSSAALGPHAQRFSQNSRIIYLKMLHASNSRAEKYAVLHAYGDKGPQFVNPFSWKTELKKAHHLMDPYTKHILRHLHVDKRHDDSS